MPDVLYTFGNSYVPGTRFYHCVLNHWGDYTCVKKDYPTSPEEGKVSQLIQIHKSVPEVFDPMILKYKLIPGVKVEQK
jgi:hypothetical protein